MPKLKTMLSTQAAVIAALMAAPPAYAQTVHSFDLPAQSLNDSLQAVGQATGTNIAYTPEVVRGKRAPALRGSFTAAEALERLLRGSGLTVSTTSGGSYLVVAQNSSATGGQGDEGEGRAQLETAEEPMIIVTGTNIRGAAPVGAPLEQLDRDDIAQSGATTVQELFDKLPQNFGGGVSDDGQLSGVGGTFSAERGAGINLRGLGNSSTLVLLNGNRLASSGDGSFVDVSMIPLSAVERVDILTDGASAIYGTDAIAGVVNIILRDDFNGAETVLRYGSVTDGGLRDYRASQTVGGSWQTGNALLTYDYSNRSELFTEERSFTEAALDPSLLFPSQERHSILGSINQNLTDSVTVFATGLYTDRSFTAQSSSAFAGVSSVAGDTQQFNITGGLNAEIGDDWSLDLVGAYSRVQRSVTDETPTFNLISTVAGETGLFTIDAKVNGVLFDMPGGAVRVAVGGQYRRDSLENESQTFIAGSLSGTSSRSFNRDVYAGFAELLLPLIGPNNELPFVNRLELSAAGRYENYSDFGSSFDPRIGVLIEPVDGFRLRGSWGTAFRAPTLNNLDDSGNLAQTLNLADPLSPTGFTPSIIRTGQNGELTAEQSTSWTIGTDIEPITVPGLSVGLTYFDIEFEERIAFPAQGLSLLGILSDPRFGPVVTRAPDIGVVNDFFGDPNFVNFFGFSPADIGAIADNRLQNISATEVRGVDYSIRYGFNTDIGQINLQSGGTYYFDFADQITSEADLVDIVDTVYNPVDFTMRNSITWRNNGFGAFIALNYVDSYTNNQASPFEEVDSWTTIDLQLSYRTGDDFSARWLRNTELVLNIDNLFDEDPPFVRGLSSVFFFDAANASPLGRFISFQITKRW